MTGSNSNKTRRSGTRRPAPAPSLAAITLLALAASTGTTTDNGRIPAAAEAKLADRARLVKSRNAKAGTKSNRDVSGRPIEGPAYRVAKRDDVLDAAEERNGGERYGSGGVRSSLSGDRYGRQAERQRRELEAERELGGAAGVSVSATSAPNWNAGSGDDAGRGDARMLNLRGRATSRSPPEAHHPDDDEEGGGGLLGANVMDDTPEQFHRRLSSQLSSCCTTYKKYYAADMCDLYGQDCQDGSGGNSHDSGDGDCEMDGLSFIGISFSVNVAEGNPYSYQLCDQFPMDNIIDRDYNYVMSMDEDGWLVGGGYKQFDYSGKMPYIDSSHTELLRVGSLDPNYG